MENQQIETIDNMKKWNDQAERASALSASAKATRDEKADAFSSLAWLSLNILIEGKLQNVVALAKAVSKDGKFQSVRACVSKAKPLALQAKETGQVKVFEGRGKKKTEKVFTKEEIVNSETPLFSVAVAYGATLKNAESLEVSEFSDKDAIALYSEKEGISVKDIKDMGLEAEAITQGRLIHAESVKAQVLENVPAIISEIESKFNLLLAVDINAAKSLFENFGKILENQNDETETETEIRKVA